MTNLKLWYLVKNISDTDDLELIYEAGPFSFWIEAEKHKNNTVPSHSRSYYHIVSNTISVTP